MSALEIADVPSPNCGPRRDDLQPSLIVIHYTAMESAEAAIAHLCDPDAEVSAHYVISITGQISRLVPEDQRAWHAGAGEWAGQEDINSRSIGIELDNRGNHPFSEPQMAALEGLLKEIMARWAIAASGVIGHSDLAPGRKSDPGLHFDWARLARQGLASSGLPQTPDADLTEMAFAARAQSLGYTAPVPPEVLRLSTRARFAPWRQGPLTQADMTLAHRFTC
ncbi:MAG: N-acetylmuramoyl-L-alanine amidase [Sulfitobacter sp.]